MNVLTKYVFNLITSMALVMLSLVLVFGWGEFIDALGGLKSFGGLLALIVMGVVLIAGIIYLMITDYTDDDGDIETGRFARDAILAFGVVVILGAIGFNWIDLPTGAGWRVIVVIVFCAVAAGIATLLGEVETD